MLINSAINTQLILLLSLSISILSCSRQPASSGQQITTTTCASDDDCSSGYVCDTSTTYCTLDDSCSDDNPCDDGYECNASTGECDDTTCSDDNPCDDGYECNTSTGDCDAFECYDDNPCETGKYCSVDYECETQKATGESCDSDDECKSDDCNSDGVCDEECTSGDQCASGECDSNGDCVPECESDGDCTEGLCTAAGECEAECDDDNPCSGDHDECVKGVCDDSNYCVENPNDDDCYSAKAYTNEYDQPDEKRSVDFLVVIDASVSMDDDLDEVVTQLCDLFMDIDADEADFQVGVLLGDLRTNSDNLYESWMVTGEGKAIVDDYVPGVLFGHRIFNQDEFIGDDITNCEDTSFYELFKPILDDEVTFKAGSSYEGTLTAYYLAITKQLKTNRDLGANGFFREDATLSVIFANDENDACYPTPEHWFEQNEYDTGFYETDSFYDLFCSYNKDFQNGLLSGELLNAIESGYEEYKEAYDSVSNYSTSYADKIVDAYNDNQDWVSIYIDAIYKFEMASELDDLIEYYEIDRSSNTSLIGDYGVEEILDATDDLFDEGNYAFFSIGFTYPETGYEGDYSSGPTGNNGYEEFYWGGHNLVLASLNIDMDESEWYKFTDENGIPVEDILVSNESGDEGLSQGRIADIKVSDYESVLYYFYQITKILAKYNDRFELCQVPDPVDEITVYVDGEEIPITETDSDGYEITNWAYDTSGEYGDNTLVILNAEKLGTFGSEITIKYYYNEFQEIEYESGDDCY